MERTHHLSEGGRPAHIGLTLSRPIIGNSPILINIVLEAGGGLSMEDLRFGNGDNVILDSIDGNTITYSLSAGDEFNFFVRALSDDDVENEETVVLVISPCSGYVPGPEQRLRLRVND